MGESFEIMRKRSLADGFTPQIERTVDDFEVGFFYILTDNLLGFVTSDYHNELFKNDLRAIPISDSKHIYPTHSCLSNDKSKSCPKSVSWNY